MAMNSEEGVDRKHNRVASTLMQEMSGAFAYEKDRMTTFAAILRELGELFYPQCHEGHGYRTDCTDVVHGLLLTGHSRMNFSEILHVQLPRTTRSLFI